MKTLFHRRGTYCPSLSKSPNAERGMEEMGGVPLTLRSHAQKVETIGRSLTSSEIYFICTDVSAIGAATEKLGVKLQWTAIQENKFWVKWVHNMQI